MSSKINGKTKETVIGIKRKYNKTLTKVKENKANGLSTNKFSF